MKTCFSLLQKCMVKINSAISETIIPVTDATAVTSDIAEGDDAAQIRSKIIDLQDDDENNYEPEMSYTYLHNPPEMIHQNNIEAITTYKQLQMHLVWSYHKKIIRIICGKPEENSFL